ncbi:MAG: beta-ketoacyl-ACP synthase II [Candidatus Margulisbacteria bacterium]|nr:beta-ketoacyl-ACP synthase II [Candidatus Margulisiibacteriota bacterium]MBU1021873.1 beta-ketoacyl-ACP synthase II [Candidatus Margulisiibacteriota bacterium]MBU1728511.1 beta-ketoacyl-ACP synthase II [Candidatus Margulisiibacteriota bacterium]MBU1954658.1 beta-ketoacyl-ACP synthase II [Candidatus Margulisiibacteriota bacterium]
MSERRVVITGMGAVTPMGIGVEKLWEGLKAGHNTVSKITRFDAAEFSTQIAAEVKDFNPADFMDKKEARRITEFIQYAIAAAKMAVAESGLKIEEEEANQTGVLIGSGIGGIGFLEKQCRIMIEKGPSRLSPFTVPMMICDMAAGVVSIQIGAKGPNSCVVTACATGTHCIGEAAEIIKRGDAEAMIAGGAEASITPLGVGSFCAAKALSASNDDPEHASRPFDKERNGFVMGEGAGIVVLESLEHAKARGAKIIAEVVGYGMSGDANHITAPAPCGEGAVRAINAALKSAKISPDQVDYINAHGTSTVLNDKYETMAIKTVFGDRAKSIPISSTKSMIGHLLGATGAVECIACVKSIQDGIIHPTINYQVPDPECDLDYVPNKAREVKVTTAMSNSFGFGGHNAILIVKKFI